MYHPEWLKRIRKMCDREGILLIADEIATGFGRTGKLFACEYAEIAPDILCLGKALTGGTMTLPPRSPRARLRKPSVTAKPVALCTGQLYGQSAGLRGSKRQRRLSNPANGSSRWRLLKHSCASNLPPPVMPKWLPMCAYWGNRCGRNHSSGEYGGAAKFFVEQGVWIRPFGKLIYLMPPYIILPQQLQRLTAAVNRAVQDETFLPITGSQREGFWLHFLQTRKEGS